MGFVRYKGRCNIFFISDSRFRTNPWISFLNRFPSWSRSLRSWTWLLPNILWHFWSRNLVPSLFRWPWDFRNYRSRDRVCAASTCIAEKYGHYNNKSGIWHSFFGCRATLPTRSFQPRIENLGKVGVVSRRGFQRKETRVSFPHVGQVNIFIALTLPATSDLQWLRSTGCMSSSSSTIGKLCRTLTVFVRWQLTVRCRLSIVLIEPTWVWVRHFRRFLFAKLEVMWWRRAWYPSSCDFFYRSDKSIRKSSHGDEYSHDDVCPPCWFLVINHLRRV